MAKVVEDIKDGIRKRIDDLKETPVLDVDSAWEAGPDAFKFGAATQEIPIRQAPPLELTPEMQVVSDGPVPSGIKPARTQLFDPSAPPKVVDVTPPTVTEEYRRDLHLTRVFGITWQARLPFDLDPPNMGTSDLANIAAELTRTYYLIGKLRAARSTAGALEAETLDDYIRAERSIADKLRAIEMRIEVDEEDRNSQ